MKRGITLLAALSFCLSPITLGTAHESAEPRTSRPANAPGPARTLQVSVGTSTVHLHNRRWNRVAVEARIGDDPNPEANRSLGRKMLKRGETWTIQSRGEDVWYHRDADAEHPDGRWTPWVHRPCYPNRADTYDESL